MSERTSNADLYPECWEFFIEYARNITGEPDICHLGNYRISVPDMSGNFIYADDPGILFIKLKNVFYEPSLDSPSVYGKIQYIVRKFKN
jgi:hypothetical protein